MLNWWNLPIGGVAWGWVCACSLNSRLVIEPMIQAELCLLMRGEIVLYLKKKALLELLYLQH